jgi:predicted metal-dependent peptidase
LLEELSAVDEPPRRPMDWRTALQMFVAHVRAPLHTWARPSRRFPDKVGEVPGRAWTPGAHARPTLLVAIDTSGSMSKEELSEIARHLRLVQAHARMIIVECDVSVRRVYPFAGQLACVFGRGGTDLRPVFSPELLGEHRPDGVVYFTDGGGPYPVKVAPVKTLWVLTSDGPFGCPWGSRAVLREPDADP